MWVHPQHILNRPLHFLVRMFKHTSIHTLCRYGQERSFSGTNYCDRERLSLTSLEVITDALLEIMEVSDSLLLMYLTVYCNSKCHNYIGIIVYSYKKFVHLLYHSRCNFVNFLFFDVLSVRSCTMHLLALHVCMYVCLSPCDSSRTNDWIFMKSDIGLIHYNLLMHSNILLKWNTLHQAPHVFLHAMWA
jgi:hypothetical protein